MPFLALLALLLLVAAPAGAQETEDLLWISGEATAPLGSGAALDLESQVRFGPSGHYESIFGMMVTGEADGLSIGAGYQHNRRVGAGSVQPEHRLRQQVGARIARIGTGSLSVRLRLEERIRSDGNDIHFRLRPRVQYSLPLGGGVRGSLSHESFFGTRADWNDQHGLFRMRNQVAISAPLAESLSVSAGYINQYGFGRGGRRDTMDHIATLGLGLRF